MRLSIDGNVGSDSISGRQSSDEGAGNGAALRRDAMWAFGLFRFRAVLLHGEDDDRDHSGPWPGSASDAFSGSTSVSDADDSRIRCP